MRPYSQLCYTETEPMNLIDTEFCVKYNYQLSFLDDR